jgi:hypothetical protein
MKPRRIVTRALPRTLNLAVSRGQGRYADHDTGTVIHAKAEPLAMKTDNAGTARPEHLNLRTIVKTHLSKAMDYVAGSHNRANTSSLPCPQAIERDKISSRCFCA